MKLHSVKPTKSERLCERCPYPARIASYCVVVETGTHRVKRTKVYLCDKCNMKLQEAR